VRDISNDPKRIARMAREAEARRQALKQMGEKQQR
jgi:hypothetical protein